MSDETQFRLAIAVVAFAAVLTAGAWVVFLVDRF